MVAQVLLVVRMAIVLHGCFGLFGFIVWFFMVSSLEVEFGLVLSRGCWGFGRSEHLRRPER